jgi:hypothetical protein
VTKLQSLRVRTGALALLASGVLTVIGLYMRGPIVNQAVDPLRFSQLATAATHVPAWSLLLPSLVIQMYGFYGLYLILAGTRMERISFAGLLLTIAGNAFFLPFVGILAFISPAAGRLYLAGKPEVMTLVNEGLGSAFATPFFAGSALLLLVGALLFSWAIWRSGSLPRWSSVPFAIHALFVTFVAPMAYVLEFTGGVLLLISVAWIAWAMWKESAPGAQAPGERVSA